MTAGTSDVHELKTDRVALTVDPAFGARVLALTDRASGRQWLLEGARCNDVSDDVVFLGDESRGWDECFPTVLSCENADWGKRLRDHGMLWGRPWAVADAGPQHLETVFTGEGVRFSRRLSVKGAVVTAAYAVTSQSDRPLPYLWSQHCVLSPREGDRIVLAGQGRMQGGDSAFDWPHHPTRDLTMVGELSEGYVLKAYAPTPGLASAAIIGRDGGLRFDWAGADVPALGLWLDYGGWPDKNKPLVQVAIEPTTGEADDLAGALALGQERWLAPGQTHEWPVGLSLLDAEQGE
ncbi:hypothetical protein [Oceaniglobus trochenteri]|uniref:hypothetical protein n=1 Tax=Oceaniglobus trochenteri TaxID=2763260 RepID=UPI001CFFF950|nr:hypothetical protein [Oceaniglobus trochenteri]